MKDENGNGKKLSWEVFTVVDKGEGKKSFWQRLGAGFENKDGSINVDLNAVPVNGRLQLRRPKAKEQQA